MARGSSGKVNQLGRKIVANAALAALAVTIAAPALASGAGSNTYLGIFPGLTNANGLYFSTYGPDPTVAQGVQSITHSRVYFNRAAWHFNDIGFATIDSKSNRKLRYEVADQNGDFTYYVNGYTYQPYDQYGARAAVSAGMWQSAGNTWHFNWWGPNLNVGVDASNSSGTRGVEEAGVGADGWGGCPNAYPVNYAWNFLYRNKNNGSWYNVPSATRYNWGNTPTWAVFGEIANGGSISFGTTTCP